MDRWKKMDERGSTGWIADKIDTIKHWTSENMMIKRMHVCIGTYRLASGVPSSSYSINKCRLSFTQWSSSSPPPRATPSRMVNAQKYALPLWLQRVYWPVDYMHVSFFFVVVVVVVASKKHWWWLHLIILAISISQLDIMENITCNSFRDIGVPFYMYDSCHSI